MIQLAQTHLRTSGSVDIRPFLEMRTPSVTSNVVINLTDNVDIHEISDDDVEILGTRESVKSDESSDADLHSKLQEMFRGKLLMRFFLRKNKPVSTPLPSTSGKIDWEVLLT